METALNDNTAVVQILLVDDSRSIRDYAQDLLDQQSYEVQVAENGFDALCKLVALPPDIVFMDSAMPELDGFQSCALITACPQFAHIPVVLMSAESGPLEQARAELAGAARLIGKPFRKSDLLDAVATLLMSGEFRSEPAQAVSACH